MCFWQKAKSFWDIWKNTFEMFGLRHQLFAFLINFLCNQSSANWNFQNGTIADLKTNIKTTLWDPIQKKHVRKRIFFKKHHVMRWWYSKNKETHIRWSDKIYFQSITTCKEDIRTTSFQRSHIERQHHHLRYWNLEQTTLDWLFLHETHGFQRE